MSKQEELVSEVRRLKEFVKVLEVEIYAQRDSIEILHRAVEMLSKNCGCSVKERLSGHLSDCWMPEVQELLNPSDHKIEGEDESA